MMTNFYSIYLYPTYIIVFTIVSSCDYSKSNLGNNTYFGADESTKQEIILKLARRSLYQNDLDSSDSLLHRVDSLKLPKSTLGFYYLTIGFLDYKNGNVSSALKYIEKASGLFDEYGNEESKGEENLIRGLIYEETNLPSMAAESFFSAMDYYQKQSQELEYFYLVLGLARTSPDKDLFLEKAEGSLKLHNSGRNSLLYYQTIAYVNPDENEQHKLYLKASNNLEEVDNLREKINLLATLALNCQMIEKNDSANYYLRKASTLVSKETIPNSRLIHYYLIKAYVDTHSGRLVEAENTLDSTIAYAKDQPAMLSQVYLRKSAIESMLQNHVEANSSLMKHLKTERQNLSDIQHRQVALMSIEYKLNQRKAELSNIKNLWLMRVIVMLIIIITMVLVFIFIERKHSKEKQAMKDLVSITISENSDLHKSIGSLGEKLSVQLLTNFERLKQKLLEGKVAKREQIILWSEFQTIFIMRHPKFYEKLHRVHPELTATDLKYCSCVYSNFSNHQIGSLLDVTVDAVKKAKKKLRKTFIIESYPDLLSYLSSYNRLDPKIDNNNK